MPAKNKSSTKPEYTAAAIGVLRGLEGVRAAPGMYTRTDSPLHIIQEALDNSADEALGGFATEIEVCAYADGSFSVADNGRGIPVDLHPVLKRPAVEIIFKELHAGGKGNIKGSAETPYAFSGGMHGVGVSVTNALSRKLHCEVHRDGQAWGITFENGGHVSKPLYPMAPKKGVRSGTYVRVWPDPVFFDTPTVPLDALGALLKAKALLMPGLRTRLLQETAPGKLLEIGAWHYSRGLAEWLEMQALELTAQHFARFRFASDENGFAAGEGADWALGWASHGRGEAWSNLVPTPLGGTHVAGMRQAVFESIREYADSHGLLPADLRIAPDDCWRSAVYAIAVYLRKQRFQGQTKDSLTAPEGEKLVYPMVRREFSQWLLKHPVPAREIVQLVLDNARRRLQPSKKPEKKRQVPIVVLPGKLADCESEDLAETEIFFVEGDSAGGSAKQARDRRTQAVLPLRGKILNTAELDEAGALENQEVQSISSALRVPLHPGRPDFPLDGLRYGKVVFLTDADDDGSHIKVLLAALFWKHFPAILANGHLWVAQPPLFRLDADSTKKLPPRTEYTSDLKKLEATKKELTKLGYTKFSVGRFKGLGEMDADQLKETTLNPQKRQMLQLTVSDIAATEEVMNMLLSKKSARARREWLERRGPEISDN